jgi:hypothetical protein
MNLGIRVQVKGFVLSLGLLGTSIGLIGCRHHAATTPPQASVAAPSSATLEYDIDWIASPADNLGVTRTMTIRGHAVPVSNDTNYVNCFGPDPSLEDVTCKIQAPFKTASGVTPGLEYKTGWFISNPKPGHWVVEVNASSSGGATANHTCNVDVGTGQYVKLAISLGEGAGCKIN